MTRLHPILFALLAVLSLAPSAWAQPIPADLGLEAFVLDFRQDGTHDPGGERVKAAYDAACEAGYAPACESEAWEGTGDFTKVLDPVDAACQQGDAVACVVAGWAMTQIRPGRVDRELPSIDAGRDRFRAACDAGLPRGCTDAALLELVLAGDKPDERELAVARLKRACQAGEGRACHYVGRESQNLQRKVWWMEQGCQAGDKRSCTALATRLRIGNGVWEDDKRALKLVLDACKNGLGEACTVAGSMVEYGEGVDASPDQAVAQYQRACRLADPRGCTQVGARLLLTNEPEGELFVRGLDYLEKACDEGDGDGCWRMSERYIWSDLDARDLDTGRAWLERGCKDGSDLACAALGQAHVFGVLGKPDPARAGELLSQACIGEQGGESCATLAWMVGEGTMEHELTQGDLLERACVADSGRGCHALGNFLLGDVEVDRKHPKATEALEAYESACRLRYRPSCDTADLVRRAIERRGAEVTAPGVRTGPVTAEEAMFGPYQQESVLSAVTAWLGGAKVEAPPASPRLRVTTCALANDYACAELVTRMLVPSDAQPQPQHEPTLAVACVNGVGSACRHLGSLASKAGKRVDAFTRYDEGCRAGDGPACFEAGRILEKGLGVRSDRNRAARAYVGACAATPTVEDGCTAAERLVARGARLADDEPGRIAALTALCSPVTPRSCLDAAKSWEAGEVVERDSVKAAGLMAKACEGGLEEACEAMGGGDPAATVSAGQASIMGPLRPADVKASVVNSASMTAYAACYHSARSRDPDALGLMSLQILVADDGQVASVKLMESSFDDDDFHGCVAMSMRQLRFPPHGSTTFAIVGQPLLFRPADALGERGGAFVIYEAFDLGEYDQEGVLDAVRARGASLAECLSGEEEPTEGGQAVVIDMDVGADGSIVDGRVRESELADAQVATCMAEALEGVALPAPSSGEPTSITGRFRVRAYEVHDLELDGAHEH